MNFVERKNILYRVISTLLILGTAGFAIWAMITILNGTSEDKILSVVACSLAIVFAIIEAFIIIKGWKKDLSLYHIAFNDNNTINTVFIIAVGIASLLGLALSITSLVLLCTRQYEPFTTSCLVIFSIGIYLLINCVIYFMFVIMFKKREYDILKYTK